jgi:hypothetical protein
VTETESSITCRYETQVSNDFGDPVLQSDVGNKACISKIGEMHLPDARRRGDGIENVADELLGESHSASEVQRRSRFQGFNYLLPLVCA